MNSTSKKQKVAVLDGVTTEVTDAQGNMDEPSPFSGENLSSNMFGGVPLSQSTPEPPNADFQRAFEIFDKQRADEVKALKNKVLQLQQSQTPSSSSSSSVMTPSPTLTAPNSEILEFFKTMEAARVKSVAEASAIQVAARKEDLKSMETLSKKLTKKDGHDKHNLKQTAIILGTAEALSALSEGHIILCYLLYDS